MVEGSANREDRRAFAGLDASGSEAPWFPLVFRSSQTEPLIGNYLPANQGKSIDRSFATKGISTVT